MPPKVNRQKLTNLNPSISAAKEQAIQNAQVLVNFSFKYLKDFDGEDKFGCIKHDSSYFIHFLGRIKNVSTLNCLELKTNHSQALRAHPINWNDTTEEKFGIPAEDQIVDQPYQFSIQANECGRVHGFFINNTFYVVWLDKHHNLYS